MWASDTNVIFVILAMEFASHFKTTFKHFPSFQINLYENLWYCSWFTGLEPCVQHYGWHHLDFLESVVTIFGYDYRIWWSISCFTVCFTLNWNIIWDDKRISKHFSEVIKQITNESHYFLAIRKTAGLRSFNFQIMKLHPYFIQSVVVIFYNWGHALSVLNRSWALSIFKHYFATNYCVQI